MHFWSSLEKGIQQIIVSVFWQKALNAMIKQNRNKDKNPDVINNMESMLQIK